MNDLPNDTQNRNPIGAAFRATLQQVEQKSPGGAALMSLAAFFAPDAIPAELFRQDAALYPNELAKIVSDEACLAALLGALADHALIKTDAGNDSFSVRAAVQAEVRDALGPEREAWASRAVGIITAAFPVPAPETWERCERLVPHVRALNSHLPAEAVTRDRGWVLGAAGVFLQERGALADALPLLSASRAVFESLAAANPDKAGSQRNFAIAHQRVGDVLEAQGKRRDALAAYQAGLAIFERLATTEPGNAGAQRDFAVSRERVGDMLRTQGDRRAALTAYQAARAIFEGLATADPGDAQAQRDLAGAYEKVGDLLLAQRKRHDALIAYQAALTLRENRAGAEPENPESQRDLSAVQIKVGDALLAQGDIGAALEAFQSAVALRERLVASDPGNAGWQRALALSYGRIGLASIRQGERRTALKAFRKGSDILADLLSKAPEKSALPGDIAWFNNQITFAGFRSYGGRLRLLGTKLLGALRPHPK